MIVLGRGGGGGGVGRAGRGRVKSEKRRGRKKVVEIRLAKNKRSKLEGGEGEVR